MADRRNSTKLAGEQLRLYVERVERLEEEQRALGADKRAVIAAAQAEGFDAKGIRYLVKLRKLKPSELQEADAIADTYRHAVGLATEPPLFRFMGMAADVAVRDQVVEVLKKFVPANGAITVEAGGRPLRLVRDKAGDVSVVEVVEQPRQPLEEAPPARPKPEVPDCDEKGAEQLGRAAYRANEPIIANPFPFGDKRRARWDLGWRKESGSDGMGKE